MTGDRVGGCVSSFAPQRHGRPRSEAHWTININSRHSSSNSTERHAQMPNTVIALVGALLVALGGGALAIPTFRPEIERRIRMATQKLRALGLRGHIRIPWLEWPPSPPPFTALLTGESPFVVFDPVDQSDQQLFWRVGGTQRTTEIAYAEAARLSMTDRRVGVVGYVALGFGIAMIVVGTLV